MITSTPNADRYGYMPFRSWCLWHGSEVKRRLRLFMADSLRRQIVKERQAHCWQTYHDLSNRVILTTARPR